MFTHKVSVTINGSKLIEAKVIGEYRAQSLANFYRENSPAVVRVWAIKH